MYSFNPTYFCGRDRVVIASGQHWLMSACCPLDVRFKSGHQADNKRTTSGQQADNKRTSTSVDLYRVLLRGGECRIGFLFFSLLLRRNESADSILFNIF